MGEYGLELTGFVETFLIGVMELYLLVVTTKDVKAAEVIMEFADLELDIDEYNVLDENRCFDPVDDRLEVIRDIGVPVVEKKCVGCVAEIE